jgi:hypothetical protein
VKNTLRTALVVLTLAGVYAGVSTPAPAATQTKSINLAEGSEPTPTTLPTSPKLPSNPKTT